MSRSTYTFSRTRALVHAMLLLFTAFTWLPFGVLWEIVRYNKN